jgi:hypothetical protein
MADRTWHYEGGEFGPEPVVDDPDRDDSEGASADEGEGE